MRKYGKYLRGRNKKARRDQCRGKNVKHWKGRIKVVYKNVDRLVANR